MTQEFNCKDESGDDIDWFIVYKFPKKLDRVPEARAKYGFMITDLTVNSDDWTVSKKEVTHKDCIFAQRPLPLQPMRKEYSVKVEAVGFGCLILGPIFLI
jgi:hypothetical protein